MHACLHIHMQGHFILPAVSAQLCISHSCVQFNTGQPLCWWCSFSHLLYVCIGMWRCSQEPADSGPYPPHFNSQSQLTGQSNGSTGTTDSHFKHKSLPLCEQLSNCSQLHIINNLLYTVHNNMATRWQRQTMLSECSHGANHMCQLIL
jgi:hypothetical protein